MKLFNIFPSIKWYPNYKSLIKKFKSFSITFFFFWKLFFLRQPRRTSTDCWPSFRTSLGRESLKDFVRWRMCWTSGKPWTCVQQWAELCSWHTWDVWVLPHTSLKAVTGVHDTLKPTQWLKAGKEEMRVKMEILIQNAEGGGREIRRKEGVRERG